MFISLSASQLSAGNIAFIIISSLFISFIFLNLRCNDFSGSRCKYATTHCYITSSYVPVGNSSTLPLREDLMSHSILYYQWVPFIFLFQAFLFFAPSLIWYGNINNLRAESILISVYLIRRYLISKSGFDLNSYIKNLKKDESDLNSSPAVNFVTTHIKTCIDFERNYVHRGKVVKLMENTMNRRLFNNGYFFTLSYFFVKGLYFAVAFVQLYLLNYWLSDRHYTRSAGLTSLLFGSFNWALRERFPRMTLCKFFVYILTDKQTHWVQCTLPINIYIEKMYIILWVWLWILLAITLVNFITEAISLWRMDSYLTKELLQNAENSKNLAPKDLTELKEYLKPDGILILKLIKSNTNRYYSFTILNNLFKSANNKEE